MNKQIELLTEEERKIMYDAWEHTAKLKRKKEYNRRFLELIAEIQTSMTSLNDEHASMINSALHNFDVDIRKLIK